jgi:hypothetical protein
VLVSVSDPESSRLRQVWACAQYEALAHQLEALETRPGPQEATRPVQLEALQLLAEVDSVVVGVLEACLSMSSWRQI